MIEGHVWDRDKTNKAEWIIRRQLIFLSQEVMERAGSCPDKAERNRLKKIAYALQTRTALTKVVPELRACPDLTLTVQQFDKDPWLLNTPGGTVDLRTGVLRAPSPDELHSKSTAVGPKEGEPTRWLRFLEEATGGDVSLQRFLWKQVGYSLSGSTQEQTLLFVHGPALTGKSVFIDTIGGMLGSYHEPAPSSTFAAAQSDRHPADLAKLAGARFVSASETTEGRAWDVQRIKSITGGDRISARFMGENFFDYKPAYKVVIVGNHAPEIPGVDDAIMRRLHVVPFETKPTKRDMLLSDKLREEWPRILSWAVSGCLLWLEEGLDPPAIVVERTAQYEAEENPVGRFLSEACALEKESVITRQELYSAWRQWCFEQGEDPGGLKQLKRRFALRMRNMGITDLRLSTPGRPHGYRGLALLDRSEEF